LRSTPAGGILKLAEVSIKFSEIIGLLEKNGFRIVKEKGSIR